MRWGSLILLIILLTSPVCSADICFDPATAARMVVDMEQCRIDQETIPILQEQVDNLNKQVPHCEQEVKVCKEIVEVKDQIIEEVKPTIWDRLGDFADDAITTVVIIGGIAAAVLLSK